MAEQNTANAPVAENGTVEAPAKRKRTVGKNVKVSTSTIIAMLKAGKSRKAIKEELELTAAQAKVLFNHEKIKGKKMKYTKPSMKAEIDIVDDLPDEDSDLEDESDVSDEEESTNVAEAPQTPVTQAQPQPAEEW